MRWQKPKVLKMSVAYLDKILEVKRYSPNTIKTYSSFLSLAKGYFKKSLNKVSEQDLYEYIYNLIDHKNLPFHPKTKI
jgi:integrase/recombinase XerD